MSHTAQVPPTPRDILARYHQAMLDLSADDLADLYAVDAMHEFPFVAPSRLTRYSGREEVRAGYKAAWGSSPLQMESIDQVVVHETTDPEVIIAEQNLTATVTTTGRRFTVAFLLVLRVRDGQLVHVRDYSDALGVALAMDRLPAMVARLTQDQPAPPTS